MAISSAISPSARSRAVGIKTSFVDLRGGAAVYLPQRVAVLGQGATAKTYSLDRRQVFSAMEAGQVYGFGSPIHLAVSQLLPVNGDGVGTIPVTVYPMEDGTGAAASVGDITPAGTATAAGTYTVLINGMPSASFSIAQGAIDVGTVVDAIVAAINANVNLPVIATDGTSKVTVTSKWKGTSADDIHIAVEGPTVGITFAITQPTSGATEPDISTALAKMGNTWETLVVNCTDVLDANLDTIRDFSEGRWLPTGAGQFMAVTGSVDTLANCTDITHDRKSDRVNILMPLPGSVALPCQVAARAVARMAVRANANVAQGYAKLSLTGLPAGPDAAQWNDAERETAVDKGCSTVEVYDNVAYLSSVITMYHPEGDVVRAYSKAVNIIKCMHIRYNLDTIFNAPEWADAPIIPNDQPTNNPAARKPIAAKAAINGLTDSLALDAVISDPVAAKESTQVVISPSNPDRFDGTVTYALSGNLGIVSIDFNFGFYYGGEA